MKSNQSKDTVAASFTFGSCFLALLFETDPGGTRGGRDPPAGPSGRMFKRRPVQGLRVVCRQGERQRETARGAHSLDLSLHGPFLGNILITKKRTLQVPAKRRHLHIANQMGIKHLKLKGLDVSDPFSF